MNADYGKFHSPFLAGTNLQYVWDSTSLGYAKECLRKYFYTMIEGWRSKNESVHLTFGSHFHKAFEYYDGAKAHGADHHQATLTALLRLLEDTWLYQWVSPTEQNEDQAVDERLVAGERQIKISLGPWPPDHPAKTREGLIRTTLWYLDEYAKDTANTLILSDGTPAIELTFKFPSGIFAPDGTEYLLSGHMDRMVEFNGDKYVMDHKTSGSSLGAYFFSQFQPDNQMSLYSLAGRIVYDTPVAGVIIDAAHIKVGSTDFARGITVRTEGQLQEWLEGFESHLRTIERAALSPNSSNEAAWPMNEKSCGAYGGCVFRKVCSVDRVIRKNYLKTDFEVRHWNPLEIR